MRITSGLESRAMDLASVELQIHCIETEAYGAVLQAFIAQSDVLSWDKEGLITELRKELRVSDVEHREIFGKVYSDESIKSIRELQKSANSHQLTRVNSPCYDRISMGHVAHKKLKSGHVSSSASPRYLPCSRPSPSAMPPSHVAVVPVAQNRQMLNPGKARGSLLGQTAKKVAGHPEFEKPGSDIIEIRATDKLIHEVEKVYGGENPDPALLLRANSVLREQEKALMEAINKLADVSDGDDSPGRRQNRYSNNEPQWNSYGFASALCQQYERTRGYFQDAFGAEHAERVRIPCVDLLDDEYEQRL